LGAAVIRDSVGYITQIFNQRLPFVKRRGRPPNRTHSSAHSREAILAKGYYHYACLKDYDTAVRALSKHVVLPNSSKIPESLGYVTRRRGQWDRNESYFNEAERLDPRNVFLLNQHAIS